MSWPARVPGSSVPLRTRLAYASPAFALATFGIPFYIYVPQFYTDTIQASAAVIGWVIVVARLFDAVLDPLIGALSDRTRSRYGRRRPWIALASFPLAACFFALLVPPDGVLATSGVWFAIFYVLVFFLWSAVQVPYEALGPEITPSYDQRTSLLALRDGLLGAGTVVAAVLPEVLRAAFGLAPGRVFLMIALVYGVIFIAGCLFCVWGVEERVRQPAVEPLSFKTLRDLMRNRPFAILLASYTVSALGSNLPPTLIPYYTKYMLGMEPGIFLILYLVPGLVCLPAWVMLAKRIGKKNAWLAALAVNVGAFFGVFFLEKGAVLGYGALCVVSGLGALATIALPSSMQADVVDYDELLSGQRREGQLYGLWALFRKLAAVSAGVSLPVLAAAGYRPNVEQSDEVLFSLRLLYALIPCLLSFAAALIAVAYPIDRATHERVLAALEIRRQARTPGSPPQEDPELGAVPLPEST
jgi:glycoside/pentoside/hexuronide:cation symporter, GPH family